MTAVALLRGSIQPDRAHAVPAEPNTNNELGRLMDQARAEGNGTLAQIVRIHVEHINDRIDALDKREEDNRKAIVCMDRKIDTLITKIDAAQSERTAALTRKPWYSEPAFHLGVVTALLAAILIIQALGPENTARAIDRIPTATIKGE